MNIKLCRHQQCVLRHYHHHLHYPLPEMNINDDIAVGSPEIDGGGGDCTRFIPRGHWKPEEDSKLKELVALHGAHNWNFIAQNLRGRSGKSCRLRWYNQLDPKLNRSEFTAEEEERLVEAQKMYGNKWATIARLYFPGRTDNAVKNHWHVLLARNDRWWRQHQQINPVSNASFNSTCDGGYKRMKHTNIINNPSTSSFNAVDSKSKAVHVDETASTCTHRLSLSAASFGRNPMPPDFQTPGTVTGSSSSRLEEGKSRQCYSPLPILSTPIARIKLGSSSPKVKEAGKNRQCYSPLPILSTPIANIESHITGSSRTRRGVNVIKMEGWGGQSESSNNSSEVTAAASESVANLKTTNQKTDQGNQLNKIAFFDFLGVGAT